jgi:hypothetical protein
LTPADRSRQTGGSGCSVLASRRSDAPGGQGLRGGFVVSHSAPADRRAWRAQTTLAIICLAVALFALAGILGSAVAVAAGTSPHIAILISAESAAQPVAATTTHDDTSAQRVRGTCMSGNGCHRSGACARTYVGGDATAEGALIASAQFVVAANGVSRLVPGGGLAAHEAAGGHAPARHLGMTDAASAVALISVALGFEPDAPAGRITLRGPFLRGAVRTRRQHRGARRAGRGRPPGR